MRENGSFNKGTESAVMQASLPIEVIPDVVTSPARKHRVRGAPATTLLTLNLLNS
jgi:hypothetical protein